MMRPVVSLFVLLALSTGCGNGRPLSDDIDEKRDTVHESATPHQPSIAKPVSCPVCDLRFDSSEAVERLQHGGKTYYFLLKDHAAAFSEDPARYVKIK